MTMAIIQEDEVSQQRLKQAFESHNIEVMCDGDTGVLINGGNEQELMVWFDDRDKLLTLCVVLMPHEEADAMQERDLYTMTSEFNTMFEIGTFDVKNPIGLILRYVLTYRGGVMESAIVDSARRIQVVATGALGVVRRFKK
jgi:hypothetical protein